MFKRLIKRILVGLSLAAPMVLLTVAFAQAGSSASEPLPDYSSQGLDCAACHSEYQAAFDDGAHGQPEANPAFDEYECGVCHDPVPADHFKVPMPVERSSEQCGACHIQTYFGWQSSKHGIVGLDCISCHDPHHTDLKTSDSSALCASCHGTLVDTFAHTAHKEQGLGCSDCHVMSLADADLSLTDKRNHSFHVDAKLCMNCHADNLHAAKLYSGEPIATDHDAMGAVESDRVSSLPQGVSPSTFALLSGLIGMATGMILSPWLERWYRRLRSQEAEE